MTTENRFKKRFEESRKRIRDKYDGYTNDATSSLDKIKNKIVKTLNSM